MKRKKVMIKVLVNLAIYALVALGVTQTANAQSSAAVKAFAETLAGKQLLKSDRRPTRSNEDNIIETIANAGSQEETAVLSLMGEILGLGKVKKGDSLNATLNHRLLTVNDQPLQLFDLLSKGSNREAATRAANFSENECDPDFISNIATKIGWAEKDVRHMITSDIVSQSSCSVDGDGKKLEEYGIKELTVLFKAAKEIERVLDRSKKITKEDWAKAILRAQGREANQAAIRAETASVSYLKEHCHLLGKLKQ